MLQRNHHGMISQSRRRRTDQFSFFPTNGQSSERFGRIFDLFPLYLDPQVLVEIGKAGGIMESKNSRLTKDVPLGMVFFGQFIDHDMTLDATSSINTVNNPVGIENFRTPNLDLDCVFGDGPEVSPFLYERKSKRLLTGATNHNVLENGSFQPIVLAQNDLPRTAQGVAIIGDPRNDENRVVSQLQLTFIRFYNAVYDDLALRYPKLTATELYEEARAEVTRYYHWIILNEFLPIICGKQTINAILGYGRQFYRPQRQPYMPVEFSVAAYRFGHSMISQQFQLQPGGPAFDLFSREIGSGFSPVDHERQIIDWRVFFDFGDGHVQLAEQLDIKLAKDLLNLPFLSAPGIPVHLKSLAVRNLQRGQSFQLPSGELVAQKMGRPAHEVREVREFLSGVLQSQDPSIGLQNGTPLWLYILTEAMVVGRDGDPAQSGEGLGPVGATLVAEVIIGLMELDHNAFLYQNRNWVPTMNGTTNQFKMVNLIRKSQANPDPVFQNGHILSNNQL